MRKQVARQQDLFNEAVQAVLVPLETQTDVVAQLAQLMQALIDAIKTEVRNEHDRH